VLAVYAGDPLSGLTALERVVDGHDDDHLVALRYHAHMIAAHLRHELSEFERAREDAAKAADLATSGNPAANSLAVAGVNSFALGDRDRALRELEDALRYFDANEPLFNPYFHRNTLLLCGLICFERGDDDAAESFCRRALEHDEPVSFEAFEACSRLGRVLYRQKRIEEAADAFEKGIAAYRYAESAPLLDVCFWLARACVDLGRIERARTLLLRIVTSEAEYAGGEDARQMLAQLGPTTPKVPTS
jgi:tetratricopeptide (TPR) repeat protein